MNEQEKIDSCIGDIVDLIAIKIGNKKREINPRDAILCSGNLIGMFMFLSFNFDFEKLSPGDVLLSNEANELGSKIISRLLYELKKYGIEIKKIKILICMRVHFLIWKFSIGYKKMQWI